MLDHVRVARGLGDDRGVEAAGETAVGTRDDNQMHVVPASAGEQRRQPFVQLQDQSVVRQVGDQRLLEREAELPARIGEVTEGPRGQVALRTRLGSRRLLDLRDLFGVVCLHLLLDLIERQRSAAGPELMTLERAGNLPDAVWRVARRGALNRIVIDDRLQHQRVVGVQPERDLLVPRQPGDLNGGKFFLFKIDSTGKYQLIPSS